MATGFELACICCGALLSAAGRAVFDELSQCKHAVSRKGVYANVSSAALANWMLTTDPAGVVSPAPVI